MGKKITISGEQDAHEIIPKLWIGNYKSSQDKKFLKENNIKYIINCTQSHEFADYQFSEKIRLPVKDNLEKIEIYKLYISLDKLSHKIAHWLTKDDGGILVHCHAGKQRSVSVVTGFFIKFGEMPPKEALQYISKIRPVASGVNFMDALIQFHKETTKHQ
jgi:protein-tyrosine phosphatase